MQDIDGQDDCSDLNIFIKERRPIYVRDGLIDAQDGAFRCIDVDYVVASRSRWEASGEALEPEWEVDIKPNGLVTAQRSYG